MIGLRRCVSQTSAYILAFEIWKIRKDFVLGYACGKKLQDVFYPDAHSANARTAATLGGIERDARHSL